MLKRIFLFSFLLLTNTSFCQDYKVYNSYSFGSTISSNRNDFHLAFGEILEVKNKISFRILANIQYNGSYIKNGTFKSFKEYTKNDVSISKNFYQSELSTPLGIEIYKNNFLIGLTQEIFSFNFRKNLDSSYFNSRSNAISNGALQSLSHLFSIKNSLNTELYIGYSIGSTMAIKLGMTFQKEVISFKDNSQVLISKNKLSQTTPFINFRFNIEK